MSTSYVSALGSWTIAYGDGSGASGHVGYDTVNLGGFNIEQQILQLATHRSKIFEDCPTDGILGLAFNSIATIPHVVTPVDNLIRQHLIDQPIFSVFYGKASEGGGGGKHK